MMLREVLGRVGMFGAGSQAPPRGRHGVGEGHAEEVSGRGRTPGAPRADSEAMRARHAGTVRSVTLAAAWDLIDADTEEATTAALTELIRLGGPMGRAGAPRGVKFSSSAAEGWLTPHRVLLEHHKVHGAGSAVARVVELLDLETPMACHANAAAAVTNLTVDRELCEAIAERGAMERLVVLLQGSTQAEVLERAAKAARNLGWEAPSQKRVAIEMGTASRVAELVRSILDEAPDAADASKEDVTLLTSMAELLWNLVSGFSERVVQDGGVEMLQRLIFWCTGVRTTAKLMASAIHCMHVLCHGDPDLVRQCARDGDGGRRLGDALVAIVSEGKEVHGEGVVTAATALLRTVGLDAGDRLAMEFYWPYARLVFLAARTQEVPRAPRTNPTPALELAGTRFSCTPFKLRGCFRPPLPLQYAKAEESHGCGTPPKDGYDLAWFARNVPEGVLANIAARVAHIDAGDMAVPDMNRRERVLQQALRATP